MKTTWYSERREAQTGAPAGPRPARRAPLLRGLLALSGFIVAVVLFAAVLPSFRSPRVLVRTMSHAVQFVPLDSMIELVAAARPRFSVAPAYDSAGTLELVPFDGIRIDTVLTEASTPPFVKNNATPASIIRRLTITRWCELTIEQWMSEPAARSGTAWIQLTIERVATAASDDPPCRAASDVIYRNASQFPQAETFTLPKHAVLVATFRPATSLQLKHVRVADLSFFTKESGTPESSILRGTIALPDYDDAGLAILNASSRVANLGDVISFGHMQGEIVELTAGDTITTVFSGTASLPAIGGKRLRPSLLLQLANTAAIRLGAAIVFSVLALVLAYLQINRHEP